MRPVIIDIAGLEIPAYGFMLVISFLAALLYVRRYANKFGITYAMVENLAFYIMLGVIIGGRLLYVAFHWAQYENDLIGIFRIWEGGMMFFGSFIAAFLAGALYIRKEGMRVLLVSDLVAPALGLGLFFTRIGCFLNGCCFGTPSQLPWSISFPEDCVAGASAVGGQPLHPTQLYEAAFGLALFFFLHRQLGKSKSEGALFAQYLILYGGFRFGIDFIRYYENAANFWINQIISLGLIIVGLVILQRLSKKHS